MSSDSEDEVVDLSQIKYQSVQKPEKKKDEVKIPEKIAKEIKPTKNKQPSEDDIIKKRRMVLLMQFYVLEFGEKLKTFKKINFEKKTYDELVEIKKEMDFTISNRSTVRQGTQLVCSGIQALEYVLLNFTPIKCEGLSNITQDEETLEDIKHLCLKHMNLVQSEPEHRIAYKIITQAFMLHNFNSYKEGLINTKPNENIEQINNKYNDL